MKKYLGLLLILLMTGCVSGTELHNKGYTHIIVLLDSYYTMGGAEYRSRPKLLKALPKEEDGCVYLPGYKYCGAYSISRVDLTRTYGFKSYEY